MLEKTKRVMHMRIKPRISSLRVESHKKNVNFHADDTIPVIVIWKHYYLDTSSAKCREQVWV